MFSHCKALPITLGQTSTFPHRLKISMQCEDRNTGEHNIGWTYNNFWKVFVDLLHKVQKVMNLRRDNHGKSVNALNPFSPEWGLKTCN